MEEFQCAELWRNTTDELAISRDETTSTRHMAHLSKILASGIRQYCTVYNRHSISLAGQIKQGKNYGPPVCTEINSVDWNNKPVKVQLFAAGVRAEWDGTCHWFDKDGPLS